MSSLPRSGLAALFAASLLLASLPALAQDAKPADKAGEKPAAAQAGTPSAGWTSSPKPPARSAARPATPNASGSAGGWSAALRDDMDTAFRHLDLYDRFGCPGPHIQSSFRCVVRLRANIDPKKPETLNSQVQACWLNPGSGTATAAAPAPATASTAAVQPAAPATQAAADQGAPQALPRRPPAPRRRPPRSRREPATVKNVMAKRDAWGHCHQFAISWV